MRKIIFVLMLFITILSGCSLTGKAPGLSELDIMAGQMVMVGFRGIELNADNPVVSDIRDARIGGVVLFSKDCALNSTIRNITGPEQLKKLTSDLQSYAETPLFVAVDQEGGLLRGLPVKWAFPKLRRRPNLETAGIFSRHTEPVRQPEAC